MSNTARVLLALVLGALIGLGLAFWDTDAAARVATFAQPIGKVWLNALQMTVVPLVAAMIVTGINTARSAASTGRTARTAIIVFVVLLSLASALTAVLAPTVQLSIVSLVVPVLAKCGTPMRERAWPTNPTLSTAYLRV